MASIELHIEIPADGHTVTVTTHQVPAAQLGAELRAAGLQLTNKDIEQTPDAEHTSLVGTFHDIGQLVLGILRWHQERPGTNTITLRYKSRTLTLPASRVSDENIRLLHAFLDHPAA